MKQSKKIILYSLVGMLAVGIFFAVSNVSAEEATPEITENNCDGTGTGTGTQKQNRHGQGTGDGLQDGSGNGNGKRHQYNATLNEDGVCINAVEA
jgi:hypothetical protein